MKKIVLNQTKHDEYHYDLIRVNKIPSISTINDYEIGYDTGIIVLKAIHKRIDDIKYFKLKIVNERYTFQDIFSINDYIRCNPAIEIVPLLEYLLKDDNSSVYRNELYVFYSDNDFLEWLYNDKIKRLNIDK